MKKTLKLNDIEKELINLNSGIPTKVFYKGDWRNIIWKENKIYVKVNDIEEEIK